MRRAGLIIFLGIAVFLNLSAQESILGDRAALGKVEQCLAHTYNFSFYQAKHLQRQLQSEYPKHPAPDFLKALIIYWENFPLLPDDEAADQFILLMDEVIEKAEELSESVPFHIEGTFFDLFGRAFKAMFWADNGKPGKVVPDLGTMYSHTMKGFDFKDEFAEFYFSTGLYNYYIEAYPEAHPAYKPIVAFMREGDKAIGMKQLDYAIKNCTYLKVEAIMFMSLIQLKYEQDLQAASEYAERLYSDYPENIYYRNQYIIVLLHRRKFDRVRTLLSEISDVKDAFSTMTTLMAEAFIEEHVSNNPDVARTKYLRCLEIADTFGDFGDLYKAIAYMGLSRISGSEENEPMRKKYFRQAENLTNYTFILSETGSGPR